MMHKINQCKICKGEGIYVHLPADKVKPMQFPSEHTIVCKGCDYETAIHRYSIAAIKEWNEKVKKT